MEITNSELDISYHRIGNNTSKINRNSDISDIKFMMFSYCCGQVCATALCVTALFLSSRCSQATRSSKYNRFGREAGLRLGFMPSLLRTFSIRLVGVLTSRASSKLQGEYRMRHFHLSRGGSLTWPALSAARPTSQKFNDRWVLKFQPGQSATGKLPTGSTSHHRLPIKRCITQVIAGAIP